MKIHIAILKHGCRFSFTDKVFLDEFMDAIGSKNIDEIRINTISDSLAETHVAIREAKIFLEAEDRLNAHNKIVKESKEKSKENEIQPHKVKTARSSTKAHKSKTRGQLTEISRQGNAEAADCGNSDKE